jgi:hypothetical protein
MYKINNKNTLLLHYSKKIKLLTFKLNNLNNSPKSFKTEIENKINIFKKKITDLKSKKINNIYNSRKTNSNNRFEENRNNRITIINKFHKNFNENISHEYNIPKKINNISINNNDTIQINNKLNLCKDCNVPYFSNKITSKLICTQCGIEITYTEPTSDRMTFGHTVDFVKYCYSKILHFGTWLASIQGRENKPISKKIIENISLHLYESGLNSKKITLIHIKKALKKLNLTRYNQNIPQIWATLTGNSPPRLTPTEKKWFETKFKIICEVWENVRPEWRTNFISYPYVIYKLCQMLGRNDFLPFLNLHKGRDKIDQEEILFKKICIQADWKFIPINHLKSKKKKKSDRFTNFLTQKSFVYI